MYLIDRFTGISTVLYSILHSSGSAVLIRSFSNPGPLILKVGSGSRTNIVTKRGQEIFVLSLSARTKCVLYNLRKNEGYGQVYSMTCV